MARWAKHKGCKTKKEAAKALGYDWSKIHNWFAGRPCPAEACPKLLHALGSDAIREATLKYALPDEVEVSQDFNSESGSTASVHLHGAKVVGETRIMLAADPLYRTDKLRLKVAGLQDRRIKILKLEQICSRERAIELVLQC